MRSPFIRSVRKAPGRQRVANAAVLFAVALGVVGVMLGTGAATTAVGVSDGMTWLADRRSGEVLQYNPSSKRVERSYQVGHPGDDISVAQDSGIVALRNERTGEVITVDMSRLRAAGARAAGGPSKVLVAKGMMVLVDRDKGILRRIDPVKATDLGQNWESPAPVADAVADQQGTVWVMAADGRLRTLVWDPETRSFDQTSETPIQRVADDGILAAHPTGVTVFGPRAGVIAQMGTANDLYRQSNQLVGIAPQATDGPSDLVVGVLANQSVVIIDRGEVRQVSTAELGCARPINPAAFNSRVYVVCQGSNKVLQLRRDGRVAGPEIITPGAGDAQPVADEGRLVLNVSGAREGIEIDRTGSDQRFDRRADADTPTMQVESKPTNEGIEMGREQARSDLAVEPLPDQPDSGSGNVNTGPDDLEDRTEVVDDGTGPSQGPSEEVTLPEIAVEPPERPAPEPGPERSGPESVKAPQPARPAPTSDASSGDDTSPADPGPAATRSSEAAESQPTGWILADSAPPAPAGPESSPDRTEPLFSDASSASTPDNSSPSRSVPVPASAVEVNPSASPSGPIPAPAEPSGGATLAPDSPARTLPSAPATETHTVTPAVHPTTASTSPTATKPATAARAIAPAATAPAGATTQSARPTTTMSQTPVPPATTRTPSSTTPAGRTSTSIRPTPSATGTPTPTQPAGPPKSPTRLRGTHSGTLATVQFDRVVGATNYTITCDDYGATSITGTSGTVACGPDSAGRPVKIGVRANNAAGSSPVVEVWIDAR